MNNNELQEEQNINFSEENDEISLGNFINKLKEYYREVLNNKKIVLWSLLLFVTILVIKAWTTPTYYPAVMTFMVNEESSGGGAAAGGFLSQFVGGGGGSSYNLSKVIKLSKARIISEKSLFDKIESLSLEEKNEKEFLANEIIRIYNLQDVWEKTTPEMGEFLFKHDTVANFDRQEKKALKSLHRLIIGNENVAGLVTIAVENDTEIFTMSANTSMEALSIELLNAVYQSLSKFYISEAIEKPKNTFEKLQIRTDSVRLAMLSLEYQLAKAIDSNRGLVTRQSQLNRDRIQRNLRAVAIEYGKLVENLGTAEFALNNETPVFQVVDSALEPLMLKKESLTKALILGGIIGIFLGVVFILFRKIFRDGLNEK